MADIWPEVSPGTGGPEECFDGSVNCLRYEKSSWKFVSIHFTLDFTCYLVFYLWGFNV